MHAHGYGAQVPADTSQPVPAATEDAAVEVVAASDNGESPFTSPVFSPVTPYTGDRAGLESAGGNAGQAAELQAHSAELMAADVDGTQVGGGTCHSTVTGQQPRVGYGSQGCEVFHIAPPVKTTVPPFTEIM